MFYQTDKDEYDQEVFCESYTFPDYEDDVMNSTENITSMEYRMYETHHLNSQIKP